MIYDLVADRMLRYLAGASHFPLHFLPMVTSRLQRRSGSEAETSSASRSRFRRDVLTLDAGRVYRPTFSPDNRYLLTVGESGMHLWELASGKEVFRQASLTYLTPLGSGCLAFAADGRSVVVGMSDTNILVWDLAATTRMQADSRRTR